MKEPAPAAETETETEAEAPQPAPLRLRFAAMFYDALLITGLLFLVTAFAVGLSAAGGGSPGVLRETGVGRFLFQLALLAVAPLYCSGFWRLSGQTPGMRAWGVALQTAEGARPGFGRGLLRCLAAVPALACLGLGYWIAWADAERRCWHDRQSGTRMVRLPRRRVQRRRSIHRPAASSAAGGASAAQNGDRE